MVADKDEFARHWLAIHGGIDVRPDISHYWSVYNEFCEIYNDGYDNNYSRKKIQSQMFKLLLYIEDMGGLGLSNILTKEYRLAEDFVEQTLADMDYNESQISDMKIVIYTGIRDAPKSSLKSWVIETFLTKDFDGLCKLLQWLMTYIGPLKAVLPNKDIIEKFFDKEFGSDGLPGRHERIIDQWLAFKWHDKQGRNLIDLLHECVEDEISKVAELDDLFDIFVCEFDKYRVTEENEDGTLTIVPLDEMEFPSNIKEPKDVPVGFEKMLLFGILIDWLDDNFMCEPYMWLHGKAAENFDTQDFIAQIKYALECTEKNEFVTLSTGEKIKKFDDLESPISFCNIDDEGFDFNFDVDSIFGDEDEIESNDIDNI